MTETFCLFRQQNNEQACERFKDCGKSKHSLRKGPVGKGRSEKIALVSVRSATCMLDAPFNINIIIVQMCVERINIYTI